MEDESVAVPAELQHGQARHIKKRALKNKSLSVNFNEKDLKDFVSGFHKRKKKRRKEAQHKLQEAQRRKRIEDRKRRKLEREYVQNGGVSTATESARDEGGDDHPQDGEDEPIPSISGTAMYDNGDIKVTVTTSEITREELFPTMKVHPGGGEQIGVAEKKQHIPVSKKKAFKRVSKRKSHRKPQSKNDRKKGKKKNKKMH